MGYVQTGSSSGAEAVLNLQSNSSLSIAYHPLFGPHDDLMLIELDEKFLPHFLQERVTLRGQPDEDAVLCTQSKTYAVKFVGNSNSIFLIPPSAASITSITDVDQQDCDEEVQHGEVVASVLKVASGNMELVEIAPRLDKLKCLLSQKPYMLSEASEMDYELEPENINAGLYRWDDLVDVIQASDDELKSALEALLALEINGYWRIIDQRCLDEILDLLLQNVILNDWSLNALDEDRVVAVLKADGFPADIARHSLRLFGSPAEGTEGGLKWQLDERRVCVRFAKRILKDGKMKMESFMAKWLHKVPEGMQAKFDMLEGEVLTEKIGIETLIYTFSVDSLPSAPAERFSILFRERSRWEWKDLQPYIRDLKVPGLSSDGLLLKYTRRTQPTMDAEPIFSAR